VGPDNRLWFGFGRAEIGAITTARVLSTFTAPSADSARGGITRGPDGNLWFNEVNPSKIGRIGTDTPPDTITTPTPVMAPPPTPTPTPPPTPTPTPDVAPPQLVQVQPTTSPASMSTPMLVFTFDQPLAGAGAENPANYHIVAIGAPQHGHTPQVTAASLDPSARTLALTLSKPLAAHARYTLTIDARLPLGVVGVGNVVLAGHTVHSLGGRLVIQFRLPRVARGLRPRGKS
jgi:hypothetical protein